MAREPRDPQTDRFARVPRQVSTQSAGAFSLLVGLLSAFGGVQLGPTEELERLTAQVERLTERVEELTTEAKTDAVTRAGAERVHEDHEARLRELERALHKMGAAPGRK